MSSRGAALQASVAKSCMPPKALSRFAELGEIRGSRRQRARRSIDSPDKDGDTADGAGCVPGIAARRGRRDRLWRGGSRRRISSTQPPPSTVTPGACWGFHLFCATVSGCEYGVRMGLKVPHTKIGRGAQMYPASSSAAPARTPRAPAGREVASNEVSARDQLEGGGTEFLGRRQRRTFLFPESAAR